MKRPLAYITAAWAAIPVRRQSRLPSIAALSMRRAFRPSAPRSISPFFLNDAVPEEHKERHRHGP